MNEDKIKLNIVNENDLMPTGKQHVSFSEMMDWVDCSWRHKLKHIDQINIEEESEHLIFGSVIHDAIENYMNGSTTLDHIKTAKDVREQFSKLQKFIDSPNEIDEWCFSIEKIFNELPGWLVESFSNYEVIEAEHRLQEALEKKKNRYFKGFIDIVLKYDELNKKENKKESFYLIGDWKSSTAAWSNSKKNDEYKQMQMVLYKYFWCKKTNTDPNKVKCAWIILKRATKTESYIDIHYVPSEQEDMEKAIRKVYEMIATVEKKIYIKNRNSCMFCKYKNTEHCT